MTTPTADQLRVTAAHEAGHGLVGLLVGQPLEYVSIRPGETYSGIAHFAPAAATDGLLMYVPAILQPSGIRAQVERSIIVSLAGPRAGLMTGLLTGYRGEDPCDEFAIRAAAALDRQSPRTRELLVESETRAQPLPDDEESAWALAEAFAGEPRSVPFHVGWLRAQAQELLGDHLATLGTIASELHDALVLTGDEVYEIASRHPCGCHRWDA